MNQDFTVQKKAIFVWKKIHAEGFTWKKIPSQAASEKNKKKFVQAENSPPPPPPHHFSNGPSLMSERYPWDNINYTPPVYVWPIPSETGVRRFL